MSLNPMKWKTRTITQSFLGILLFYILLVYKMKHQVMFEAIVNNSDPKHVWEFVADFSNMKKLNPTIEDFLVIAESGNYDHWKYSVEYTEHLSHLPMIRNVAHGHYAVRPDDNGYVISSKHRTCFVFGFYCYVFQVDICFSVESVSQFRFDVDATKDTKCIETVQYECPVAFSFLCILSAPLACNCILRDDPQTRRFRTLQNRVFSRIINFKPTEMATSESDADFESADEELISSSVSVKKNIQPAYKKSTVDSESDSDTEYVERPHCGSSSYWTRSESKVITLPHEAKGQKVTSAISDNGNKMDNNVKVHESDVIKPVSDSEKTFINRDNTSSSTVTDKDTGSAIVKTDDTMLKVETTKTRIVSTNARQKASTKLGAKKLGTRLSSDKVDKPRTTDNIVVKQQDKCLVEHFVSKNTESTEEKCEDRLMNDRSKSLGVNDLLEPEELKSNKKFKEVFQLKDWEGLDAQLPDELTEEKLQPVLEKLSLTEEDQINSLANWSSWGNWNVSSLIDTATTSMTTLSTHVSQGLNISKTYISQGLAQDPTETITQDEAATSDDKPEIQEEQTSQSYSSFGLGNLMSGVSSITKLVESTGSKVMTGGLDTLEAIGKKTMEVLQEGDPGLMKKRAFFTNELKKPILSQILREAKEKAETVEKTAEERELARQVNFGSLFDDYQGLVHLEVLEILSRQSNIKIQQHLIELDEKDSNSVKETLEEIKELCDLDEEHSDDEICDKDLKDKLQCACRDLDIDITYEKLHDVWIETENYFASSPTDHEEIFRNAISTLAKFTAFSIERFHKTAELLLIKKRRRTVSEADALVQLARILSNQISSLAKLFCQTLKQFAEIEEKSDKIKTNVTTTFTEASNANLYIRSAFKLLIPIVQVGAIF